jgi:hypothetical protein
MHKYYMTKYVLPASTFNYWFQKLVKSLYMHYSDPDGGPKTDFRPRDKVRAEPRFDNDIVESMYSSLPRMWAQKIYKEAFDVCKARADRMLKDFQAKQQVINRRHYYNALYRFSLFAPNEAAIIDRRRIKGPAELLHEFNAMQTVPPCKNLSNSSQFELEQYDRCEKRRQGRVKTQCWADQELPRVPEAFRPQPY